MGRHEIGRLNLGPVPTSVLQWDQPHEGNIFTHLYQQRAFQRERLPLRVRTIESHDLTSKFEPVRSKS